MVTVALVTLFVACAVVAWLRGRSATNEPPVLPGAWPLVGHAHLLLGDTKHLWNFIKRVSYETLKAGGLMTIYLGPSPVYLVTDPEDGLVIANTCLQKPPMYDISKPWLGDGLITAEAGIWKKHRQLLNPAFNQVVLEGFLGVFNVQARRLVKGLETEVGKGPFNVWVYTKQNSLETLCLNIFGVDLTEKSSLHSKYVDAVEQILKIFVTRYQKFWLTSQLLFDWSSLKKRQDECVKILHNMSNTVLNKSKAEYTRNINGKGLKTTGSKFKPLMDRLSELSQEQGVMQDREIRNHMDTMIVAGYETSASVTMFAIILVGSYPEVQQKIADELHTVFGNEDRDVTMQDLSRLVYLEVVIKETLRIYPIVALTARLIDRDLKLRNYTLKKGRMCMMLPYGVHRHPMWGPNAEEFRPERWLDPATLPKCPHAFAAFNIGRRTCIGSSYAYMSTKTTLAHVFRRYRVFGDHTQLVIKYQILLTPESGHYINIENKEEI